MATQFNIAQYHTDVTVEWAEVKHTCGTNRTSNNWLMMNNSLKTWAQVKARAIHDSKMTCEELKAEFNEWHPRMAEYMKGYFGRSYTAEELTPIIAHQTRLYYKNAVAEIKRWELYLAECRAQKNAN